LCLLRCSVETVEVDALVAEEVLLEAWHVERIDHGIIVDVEMLPSSGKVLIHEVIKLFSLDLLLFANNVLRQVQRLLLVHHERAGRLSLIGLLLEREILDHVSHELVG